MPVRIAYISADRGIVPTGCNGAATHIRELANALVGAGADVKMLVPRPAGDGGLRCELLGFETDPTPSKLRRLAARAEDAGGSTGHASELHGLALNQALFEHLQRLHAQWPIDLVYERQSLWSYAGLQFAQRNHVPFFLEVNAPLVVQQEQYRELYSVAAARAIEELLLGEADRVIVPSKALIAHVVGRGSAARRVRVIPCGVARDLLTAEVRVRLAVGHGEPFVVGFVGSLKPWHGVENLLEAFAHLVEQYPGYRLLVVGDGPLRGKVEELCRESTGAERVTITGEVPHQEVARYLAGVDVGVAPYPALPMFYFSPLKIFEYAAAGVPIVASAAGQITEILAHRRSALLHEPGDTMTMVAHIEKLRARPDLRARLARRAHNAVARAYTWDYLASRLLETARHCVPALA